LAVGRLTVGFTQAADGVPIHFQVLGRGEPLLMIQGLGADMNGWMLQRLAFSPHFRTIALDNRGAGRSGKPPGPYSLTQMADDAVAVLDHLGIERAHVMGASMGGAVAQLLAVRHRERVRSLTLACTACSNPPWRRDLLDDWAHIATERGMNELSRRAMRWLIGPRSLRRFWPALGVFGPMAMTAPPHAFAGQIAAILAIGDDVAEQLRTLEVPTLVLVGSQDILTPVADAEEIAEHIPHARLAVVTGAAHGFMVEHARTYNRLTLDFLRTTARPSSSMR
jgi:3-oxoadipate enol-lactonase